MLQSSSVWPGKQAQMPVSVSQRPRFEQVAASFVPVTDEATATLAPAPTENSHLSPTVLPVVAEKVNVKPQARELATAVSALAAVDVTPLRVTVKVSGVPAVAISTV